MRKHEALEQSLVAVLSREKELLEVANSRLGVGNSEFISRHGFAFFLEVEQCTKHKGVSILFSDLFGESLMESQSRCHSRRLKNLESKGLIDLRNGWGSRQATHCRLTTEGREKAIELGSLMETSPPV